MPQPYEFKIQKIEKQNMDLLYAISDGKKVDMDAWAATDVREFFLGLWTQQDAIEKRLAAMKEGQKK